MDKQILDLEVIDLNHEGYGVSRHEGLTVFIPNALPKEKIKCEILKQEKTFARAKLLEVIKSSAKRVNPLCPAFPRCGGCDLLHLDYQEQLAFKKKMVEETFKRIGHLEVSVAQILGADKPLYYRNKVQIPVSGKNGKLQIGYYERKSHAIVALDKCFIQSPEMTDIAIYLKELFRKYNIDGYDEGNKLGQIRHIIIRKNKLAEYMVVLVSYTNIGKVIKMLTKDLITKFGQIKSLILNFNPKTTNVILGQNSKLLYGVNYLSDEIDGLKFQLSPQSFYQINSEQTEKLYKVVKDLLNPRGDEVILDAYCGVGTISLYLSRYVKSVIGIEVNSEAIKDANNNMHLNGINNTVFQVGLVEETLPIIFAKTSLDALIVDPPRKGLEKTVIEAIIQSSIKKIIYVSCDPATLARDLGLLSKDYTVKKVICVDMFPQTANVETVALLIKNTSSAEG